MPIELENHPMSPPHFNYIWEWFFEFGPDITWAEIKAWDEISGVGIERWEGDILMKINHLRNSHGG